MPKKSKEKNKKDKNMATKVSNVSEKHGTNKVIETKETVVVKKKKEKKGKGKFKALVNKVVNNTPFVVALCVILLLVGALLYTMSIRRIPKTDKGSEIVATIKGKKITAENLYQELKKSNGTDALINMIDTYIAEKEVEVTKDDKEYVTEVVDYYKDYAKYYGTDLATFLANYVGLAGITTEEEFYDYVLEDYKKTLAVQQFVADEATEEELKEYYKENYSDKLTVKHILIEVDAEAEDKEAAEKEAYNEAVKLIKKLKDTDKSKLEDKFEDLAKKNSDDTATYSDGGLIEDFTKKDVVEEFWSASEKLKNGEYTKEPVKSQYGYHIILKIDSTPVEKYKDIKDDVKKAYAESKLSSDSTLSVKKWDELRNQYKLSIKDDEIKSIYKNTIDEASKTKEETK